MYYSIDMKLMRIRTVGHEQVLGIPKKLAKGLSAEYMAVQIDESGRLIYTPIGERA